MPHKHNADRRHHIPRSAFKVENRPEYEAGLRRRGSLTLWIEDAALDYRQTFGPGGQARYKNAAIQTTLMVRTAFRLASRQTAGTGPQVYGASQWLEAKLGARSRRKWRELHLAVDADNGMIAARTLTDQDADDPFQVAPLPDKIDGWISRVTADGAYDDAPTNETIAAHGDDIEVVIPPRSTAVVIGEQGPFAQRDRPLEMITERGRLAWQKATDYGKRAGRNDDGSLQRGDRTSVAGRGFAARQAAVSVVVLNPMLAAGRPDAVRRMRVVA